MNGYEKLISVIREEGGRGREEFPVRLGTVGAEGKCSVGGMELEPDDYVINKELENKMEPGDAVLVAKVSSDLFAVIAKVVGT